jgi:uncharacterized protein (TIGR02421 family)
VTLSGAEAQHLRTLDAQLIAAAREIKVLSRLAWPADSQKRFLDAYRRNAAELPAISYPRLELADQLRALEQVDRGAQSMDHPAATYIGDTARSYLQGARLLEHVGTPAFTNISIEIYGKPGDLLPGGRVDNVAAARHFIAASTQFFDVHAANDGDAVFSAQDACAEIERQIRRVIDDDVIAVVVDAKLAAKATAGATRIRLRANTPFSQLDIDQLLQHEAFVHSLTALNGRKQPVLKCLSLGAPRTTAAQEGLATFAELVTGTIDIARMERIAQRIIAVDLALNGADFFDVFRHFLDSGQPETESFNATMRVFRGAPLTGGGAFTKDSVYLDGMLEVHTFFRWALKHQRLKLCEYFFAGRMTLHDIQVLEPLFVDGTLDAPRYLPPWMTRTNGLTAYLAFAVFANEIPINELGEDAYARPAGPPVQPGSDSAPDSRRSRPRNA